MSTSREEWTKAIAQMGQRSKYGARKKVVDGLTFDSTKEAKRYQELRLREKAGEIEKLEVQPRFDLYVTDYSVGERLKALARKIRNQNPDLPRIKIGTYVADFSYWAKTLSASENDHYTHVVEDVKGVKTPLYKWKKKHVEAQYGITIQEV